jgi:hypothetical protein
LKEPNLDIDPHKRLEEGTKVRSGSKSVVAISPCGGNFIGLHSV